MTDSAPLPIQETKARKKRPYVKKPKLHGQALIYQLFEKQGDKAQCRICTKGKAFSVCNLPVPK